MRILNIIFIALFILAAALQYNDPDPYLWMPLYSYGAYVCYTAYRKQFFPALYIIGWIIYLPYAMYLFFGADGVMSWWSEHGSENIAQSMKAAKPWIEETREFFGLLVLSGALLANWLWFHKRQKDDKKTMDHSII